MNPKLLVFAALSAIAGWLIRKVAYEARIGRARRRAERLLDEARIEGGKLAERSREQAKREVRAEAFEQTKAMEAELSARRRSLDRETEALAAREAEIDTQGDLLERKAAHVERRADELIERLRVIGEGERRIREAEEVGILRLEEISALSRDDAARELKRSVAVEARADAEREAARRAQEARAGADREARKIVAAAIQRVAETKQFTESTVTVVELASEDLKGRIIGKEGRNIRSLELETGVDVIIDDTPERVFLSSFDPERREIARLALERLLVDGRVHPARIESTVAEVRAEFDQQLRQLGENAAFECEVYGLAEDLILSLGQLGFRTFGGQNMLQHSTEVAQLAGSMAQIIDADEAVARRAGLLHDVGWAVGGKGNGSPWRATALLLERCGESAEVVQAVRAVRRDGPATRIEGALAAAANTMSEARPGARREPLKRYVRRMEAMERLATELPGVVSAYAIEAGRELEVMVDPECLDDIEAFALSRKISRKIEKELVYSGAIRVTVIRQFRSNGLAR